MNIAEFRKIILDYYAVSGRDFPWRSLAGIPAERIPWAVLVSEFMLQQTQTARVVPYWEKWIAKWPSPLSLAAAPLEEVLREWGGLGYNRRAKNLWECARAIMEKHGGEIPKTPEELETLPGIGPYTAGAAACFAFNFPAVFIETNIRAALIHFFFRDTPYRISGVEKINNPAAERRSMLFSRGNGFEFNILMTAPEGRSIKPSLRIKDGELFPILEKSLDRENPRRWYWALMDYGAELKKVTINPNRKSAHYARQSPFKGSLREIRGAIVRNLSRRGRRGEKVLFEELKKDLESLNRDDFYRAITALKKDMMVAEEGGEYRIY